jgi:hypothetical protein
LKGRLFVFACDQLLRIPGEEVVATHVRNQWQVGHDHYLRLEIVQPVECHFHAVDGVLLADDRALAMFKGAKWSSLLNEAAWTRIAITQAG